MFQVRTLARTDEARGLLWLMEEEALQPGGSEETLLERLFSYYSPVDGESKGQNTIHLPHAHPRTYYNTDVYVWKSHATSCAQCIPQAPPCCWRVRKHITSCWVTAMGLTGWSMMLAAGWAMPNRILPLRMWPFYCRTLRSKTLISACWYKHLANSVSASAVSLGCL